MATTADRGIARRDDLRAEMELDIVAWLNYGRARGYCSDPVCATHDMLPCSDEEEARWEAGDDPCVTAVRLYPYGDAP